VQETDGIFLLGPSEYVSSEDGDTIQSLNRRAFAIKDRTMDNVRNCVLICHGHKPINLTYSRNALESHLLLFS
jgi:hypothetical protein